MKDWSWRAEDREASKALGLLYAPGNWGDILKGLWVAEVAREIRNLLGSNDPLVYGDPFAGAPEYPALEGVGRRVEAVLGTTFEVAQRSFLAARRFASSATLVSHVAGISRVRARVFDADPDRRDAWRVLPGCQVLEVADGWAALERGALAGSDLVLVDPYDLDLPANWTRALTAIGSLVAGGTHVLAYFYNRSPRGPQPLAEYRRFRDALREALGREPDLVGRVPTDSLLPRAWHEMILVRSRTARRGLPGEIAARLASETERLSWSIFREGAVELASDD